LSLVTRCPACSTQFKVVRDQLRISDGWVRCGRCSQVFDASLDLRESTDVTARTPAPSSGDPVPAHEQHGAQASHEQQAASDAPAVESLVAHNTFLKPTDPHIDLLAPLSKAAETTLPTSEPQRRWPARELLDWMRPQVEASRIEARPPPKADVPTYGLIADEPWPLQPIAPSSEPAVVIAPVDTADGSDPTGAVGDLAAPPASLAQREPERIALTSPSLESTPAQASAVDLQLQKALRRARAKADKIARSREKKAAVAIARAGGPAVGAESLPPEPLLPTVHSFLDDDTPSPAVASRALSPRRLKVAAALAVLLLVVQVMRQERDVLAARQPGLQPVLSLLCSLTGCEVSALRQIASITIDGAAFARDKDANSYRLSFALRNSAAMPLAMPAVELTLLDTQERAVVRRVILPAEFGAPSVLAANGERAASLVLTLNGTEAAALPPVAGYRVLAFYP